MRRSGRGDPKNNMKALYSMTGYGSSLWDAPIGRYRIEIKSLNHRYLEVRIKLPSVIDAWEFPATKVLTRMLDRGRVSVTVSEVPGEATRGAPRLDLALAASYVDVMRRLKEEFDLAGEVTVDAVSRMRDVIVLADAAVDIDQWWKSFEKSLEEAVRSLMDDRAREGEVLRSDFMERTKTIGSLMKRIEASAPRTVEHYRERLTRRIEELSTVDVDPGRLEQEVVVFADRCDVTEEIVRFNAHVDALTEAVTGGSPAGRRLDFILQELGREINTIGSKNQDTDISVLVVDVKVELEKMREQAQNVE